MSVLAGFEEVQKEFYPGTTREIVRKPRKKAAKDTDGWDARPRIFHVGGEAKEFFDIGALARALGRKPVTIRAWEQRGFIPKATFRRPSESLNGTRRLYSREQIEGMVRIAEEEGLLKGDNRSITATDFAARVLDLFRTLATQ